MYVNADCTLYKYDKTTGGYIRFFIEGVYWQENKSANVLKNGLVPANSTMVFFYCKSPVPENPTKDILVKGCCEFEFNKSSQQTISYCMKKFRETMEYVTVSSIDNYWYGGLPHYEISAK